MQTSFDAFPAAPAPACKGVFFRYTVSSFVLRNGVGIGRRELAKLLKRKSCKGCPECAGLRDEITGSPTYRIEIDEFAQNGETLRASIEVDSYDQESGHPDDWHVVLTRVQV